VHTPPLFALQRSQAQQPGLAQRRRARGSPPTTTSQLGRTPKKAKPSATARPSAAEKGGSGVSPDYGNPTRTHAEEGQVKRSGKAERSEEGGFGGLPRLRHNTARPRAEESQAQRLGRAQRRRGVLESLPSITIQLARTPKGTKPSGAARPSSTGKVGFGVYPDYNNPTRTHAKEGQIKLSGQAERGVEGFRGVFPDYDTTQHAHAQKKAKRSNQAVRSGEGRFGSPQTSTIPLARSPKKAKPSAAARPECL
jgi:hypothetical protein